MAVKKTETPPPEPPKRTGGVIIDTWDDGTMPAFAQVIAVGETTTTEVTLGWPETGATLRSGETDPPADSGPGWRSDEEILGPDDPPKKVGKGPAIAPKTRSGSGRQFLKHSKRKK